MASSTIISLAFLILGGGFVITLLKGIMGMLQGDFDTKAGMQSTLWANFKWTLIFVTLLLLFVFFVMPNLN